MCKHQDEHTVNEHIFINSALYTTARDVVALLMQVHSNIKVTPVCKKCSSERLVFLQK